MVVAADRKLLWHPRGENKFVVGGSSQITLYEWSPETASIRHLSSQHELSPMKCIAWSPDAAFDDLVAVGLGSGKVELLRLEAAKHASRSNVLSPTGPVVSLPVQKSRSCNSIAFNYVDSSILAVALDKVRGDCSLMIWDINSASTTFTTSALGLTSNDHTLVPPGQTRQHRIPRGDMGSRIDSRVLQQHAPTEVVSSVAFLRDSTHLLLSGISSRWLRLFDLRSAVPSTTNVASKVQGITTDPFDSNRVATYGDGIVTVWDTRHLYHPLLIFSEKDAIGDGSLARPQSMYAEAEFSSIRRGTLATLEKDSSHIRFWDLTTAQIHQADAQPKSADGVGPSATSRPARKSWANLPWANTGSPEASQSPKSEPPPSSTVTVLSDTRKTKDFEGPLASFSLVPNVQANPLTSEIMVVNRDGDLELYSIHDTPKQATWSSRGDFAIGVRESYRLFPGFEPTPEVTEPWDAQRSRSGESKRPNEAPSQKEDFDMKAKPPPPALFGRGDEEGFPALGSVTSPPIAAGTNQPQPSQIKTNVFSPSHLRDFRLTLENVDPQTNGHSQSIQTRGRLRATRRDANSVKQQKQQFKSISNVVQSDLLMILRRRALEGYGLSNPRHNIFVTRDLDCSLSDIWSWITHAQEFLCSPVSRLNGYEFAHVGVLGIWEGMEPVAQQQIQQQQIRQADSAPPLGSQHNLLDVPGTGAVPISASRSDRRGSRRSRSPMDRDLDGNFQAALFALLSRRGSERGWKASVPTTRTVQRQVALQLCGWNFREDDLMKDVRNWEKDGQVSRAACWLVFTKQYSRAVEVLMRSNDESHHMMSGTLAALVPHGGSSKPAPEVREHCERLIVRLQDPYFRVILIHLTLGDWSDVLDEDVLPLIERLAIALQFLEDKTLTSYLRRTVDRACTTSDINSLVITGLTKRGLDIIQNYVDHTGDIQTAAILGSYVCPSRFRDTRVERWKDCYREYLDGMKLYHHRVSFDIECGQILTSAMHNGDIPVQEVVPRQIVIRCNYCNKPVTSASGSGSASKGSKPTTCQNCSRSLPRCSICLMVLSIVPDGAREAELSRSSSNDTIDDAIVTCQTCRHAGHASHILEWFFGTQSHGVCAVADCDCRCADEF